MVSTNKGDDSLQAGVSTNTSAAVPGVGEAVVSVLRLRPNTNYTARLFVLDATTGRRLCSSNSFTRRALLCTLPLTDEIVAGKGSEGETSLPLSNGILGASESGGGMFDGKPGASWLEGWLRSGNAPPTLVWAWISASMRRASPRMPRVCIRFARRIVTCP